MDTDNQQLILVDDNDKFLGYEKRSICHTGKGVHHRAFIVLLENSASEVLLQKRKHKLWDGFWDTTAISHPLHFNDHDESYSEAGNRALMTEMGIDPVILDNIGGFNYFAPHGKNCENEYCAMLVGTYEGDVILNPDSVYEYKWMNKNAFINLCKNGDDTLTPWAILTGKYLMEKNI